MLQLNSLHAITKKRKRVGRGGHKGGHSGRGKDGQKCRSGAGGELKAFFEGGQMPLSRRIPRRGFNNPLKKEFKIISLSDLDVKFMADETVSRETLSTKGLIKGSGKFLIKVLGNGTLTKNLKVVVDSCSKSASEAIQKAGGSVQLIGEMSSGGLAS
jgi:large subunit ribosomal protein L15